MKIRLFSLFGVLCLALISYEFHSRTSLWNIIMNGVSGRDREKYMILRDVFLKKYGEENLYQITNISSVTGISILLGVISMVLFFLVLTSMEKKTLKSNIFLIKKIVIVLLWIGAAIITFMNLWTLM